jgi:hypothetical protein
VVEPAAGEPRLTGRVRLSPGRYALHAWRDGTLHRTRRSVQVTADRTLVFD